MQYSVRCSLCIWLCGRAVDEAKPMLSGSPCNVTSSTYAYVAFKRNMHVLFVLGVRPDLGVWQEEGDTMEGRHPRLQEAPGQEHGLVVSWLIFLCQRSSRANKIETRDNLCGRCFGLAGAASTLVQSAQQRTALSLVQYSMYFISVWSQIFRAIFYCLSSWLGCSCYPTLAFQMHDQSDFYVFAPYLRPWTWSDSEV